MDSNSLVEQSADRASEQERKPKWRSRAYALLVLVKLAELIGKLVDLFSE